MEAPGRAIEQYHRNMFNFDQPNPRWIASCAAYLNSIIPGGVEGKRVVDYGFGRGNWSLAFVELGASQVIAIDASAHAVDRFSSFVNDKGIDNISVRLGNSDEEELQEDVDVVFLYGILHHVKRPVKLLETAARMCNERNGSIVVYSYNADSLRQTIAEICRSAVGTDMEKLRDLSLTLHPEARIRAMDDLTAPFVFFWNNSELQGMVEQVGLAPVAQVADFAAFEGKSRAPEFEPYVLIASPRSDKKLDAIAAHASPNLPDLAHLTALADLVLVELHGEDRVKFAVGLYNTSFAVQGASEFFERVFGLWRYLVQAALALDQEFRAERLPASTKSLFEATCQRPDNSDIPHRDGTYSDPESSLAALAMRGGFRL